MCAFRQQLITCFSVFFLLICVVHCFRVSDIEHENNGKNLVHEQNPSAAARLHALNQALSRRSFYDPAFGDSWSKYLEKKRSLFDPAYNEWANSFKRSDE